MWMLRCRALERDFLRCIQGYVPAVIRVHLWGFSVSGCRLMEGGEAWIWSGRFFECVGLFIPLGSKSAGFKGAIAGTKNQPINGGDDFGRLAQSAFQPVFIYLEGGAQVAPPSTWSAFTTAARSLGQVIERRLKPAKQAGQIS